MTTASTRPPGTDSGAASLPPPPNPRRRLEIATFVSSFGNGLYLTVAALYFTRTLGFGASRVGVVLTVAGLAGVLASLPAGRAADRFGIKPVYTLLLLAEAVTLGALAFCTSFWAFAVVACLSTAVDRAASAVRQALYAQAFNPETRVADRAAIRAVTNVAIGVGAAAAALVLQADSRWLFQAAILSNALSFVGVVVLLPGIALREPVRESVSKPVRDAKIPDAPASRRSTRIRVARSYQAVSALNAVMTLQFAFFDIGLPLWLLQDTRAPRFMVSGMLILNTVLVALFQVRVARGVAGIAAAARATWVGALILAAACVVTACAKGLSPVAAVAVLLVAALLLTAGEMLNQAGAWTLSYDLADERAVGAYQGAFNAGTAAGQMAGPLVVTQTAIRHGLAGWAVLGAVFALAGLAMAPVARWAAAARRSEP
ncbi:major facilitator superfamily MFS_1 [Catenulispora acidiphila DSM 44928]|uniref:Major facilitator superfamily MFS_1 n=1 Tax=Catenulispora acidiphila (strain DSM 44928 / JCM 14897 / NBRC 102108 / NRRL B-24433 / ID139908) TaxID=479433 RepID=C7PX02_CATAD|nr:MFS transporter [Catenulispora acidiphila]ACU77259.1 major facilitator superfamily MFS_1 [Catenulispora acidiphila DSM 44928]